MKVSAELIEITEKMTNKELVDALNKNFQELKETSENRDQAILNSIGSLDKQIKGIKTLIEFTQDDMIKRSNNSNEKINTIDGKLDKVLKWIDTQSDNGKNLLT